MPVALYTDVETALGRLLSDQTEIDQVDWWLIGIELTIANRLGDVTLLDRSAVRYVEAEAVAEKVRRRGTNESSITVSVDDGSITRRFDNPSTVEDIADEWWNLLSPTNNAESASIRPSFEADDARWPARQPGYWGARQGEWGTWR